MIGWVLLVAAFLGLVAAQLLPARLGKKRWRKIWPLVMMLIIASIVCAIYAVS